MSPSSGVLGVFLLAAIQMLGVERTPTSSLEEVPEPQSINLLVYTLLDAKPPSTRNAW